MKNVIKKHVPYKSTSIYPILAQYFISVPPKNVRKESTISQKQNKCNLALG